MLQIIPCRCGKMVVHLAADDGRRHYWQFRLRDTLARAQVLCAISKLASNSKVPRAAVAGYATIMKKLVKGGKNVRR